MNGYRSARKNQVLSNSKTQRTLAALSAATGLVAWAAVSKADTYGNDYAHDGNQINLNSSTAWVDETNPATDSPPPGANDVAQFDSNTGLGSTTTFTIGANTTWDGISLTTPGAAVVIGNSTDDVNTLALGTLGINMLSANQSLTISDPLSLAANATFAVDGGQSLTVNGGIGFSAASVTLSFSGAGTQNINSIINDNGNTGSIAQVGSGTTILTAANNFTGTATVDGGTLELNFAGAGAPASNIISGSLSGLRLGGGTLLINSATGAVANSQTFAGTSLTASEGMTIVQVNQNGSVIPTLNMGTITVDTASTNAGGLIDFVGPATSSDGLDATPIAATASITVGSTTTSSAAGNVLIDGQNTVPFAVVGQPGHPNTVTDFAAVANGVVVGGSTISGFYTPMPVTTSGSLNVTENIDLTYTGEVRFSGNTVMTSLRFNTPTGGLYNDGVNNMDQILLKSGNVLEPGAILVTPNVGANNVLIQSQGGPSLQVLGGEGNNVDVTVYQYNTQGAFIVDGGIRAASGHAGGYAQAGPGTVQLNGDGSTAYSLPTNLYGGLTVLGNFAQGAALGSSSAVVLNGGNLDTDYNGTFDNGSARPVTLDSEGGGLSATAGHTLTVDGALTGSGPLNIGYGTLVTNEENNVSMVVTTATTSGNGVVILSGSTANTYTGGTNVNYGTLRLDTNSAGTGTINVNSGAALVGNATALTNAVVVNSGAQLTPGDPTANGPVFGTLGVNALTLNSGSITNFAFGSGSNSMIDVEGPLVINSGADLDVYVNGTTNPFTQDGTYDLFELTDGGTVSGLSNITVGNSPGGTVDYTFGTSGEFVTMTITGGSTQSSWNIPGSGSWMTAGNWNPSGVPNSVGTGVTFGSVITANATVTLDGSKTVGSMNFQSPFSYTIAPGSGGTLTLQNNGSSSAVVTDSQGNHFINVPLLLNSNASVTVTSAGNTLAIGGAITGSGALGLNSGGLGTVLLTGNNSYGGATTINGGTVQVGTGGSSGSFGTNTSIANSGALIMDVTTNQVLTVAGSGSLTQSGNSTLGLTGTNTASAITITNGEIQLATGASLTATGDLTANGTLDLNGNSVTVGGLAGSGTIDNVNAPSAVNTLSFGSDSNSNTFSGVIKNTTGTMSVIKNGTGTETLSGLNTFSGGLTINAGQVIVNQSNGVGGGAINDNAAQGLVLGNGVTLSNAINVGSGSSEYEDVAAGGSATLSGPIAAVGSGQIRMGTSNTSSTLNLTGATTGGTSSIFILTRGNVVVSGAGSIACSDTAATASVLIGRYSSSSTLNLTLDGTASLSSVDGISVGSGNAADDASISVTLNGASTMNAGGGFELDNDLNNGTTSLALNGTSNLTATRFTFTNNSGTSASSLTMAGGTITAGASDPAGGVFMPWISDPNINNFTQSLFSMSIQSGGGTINNGGYSITVAQNISDGGGGSADTMTFTGTGTTVLANANTYAGNTTLNAGTLIAANGSGSATGSGTVTLNGGVLANASSALVSTLAAATTPASQPAAEGAGTGSIAGRVVSGSGPNEIAPGGLGTIGTLDVGGITTNSNMTIDFDLGAPVNAGSYSGDLIDITSGPLTVGAGTQIAFGTNPTTVGDYELFTGSFGSPTLSNFILPSQAGFTYSLSTTVQSGFVDLVVSAGVVSTSVFWDNAGASAPDDGKTWDTTNNNWNNGSSTTTYANGDAVTFNDTNNGNYSVTLNTTVSPSSVTVNNSSGNYSITGTGKIADAGAFTKSGTGSLTLGTALTVGSMSITGGTMALATNTTLGSGSPTSNINISSMSITGTGQLDITNNHIIIDYGSSDPMSTIYSYLKSGYNNGGWNGLGIISSTARTLTNGLKYGIGFSDGNDKIGGHSIVTGLSSGQIELKYTLLGDANLDGTVNGSDFSILAANFGQGYSNWDQGNFEYTPAVNGTDFSALAANFGQGDSGAAASVSQADIQALDAFAAANGLPAPTIAAVPEPATIGLLTVGTIGVLARRRRRSNA